MAQIPKGRLVEGPYKPICRDCAIYFLITVPLPSQDERNAIHVALNAQANGQLLNISMGQGQDWKDFG